MTTSTPQMPEAYRPCVGIMVLNRQGLVWVGRRADAPGDAEGPGSWWQMPQGGIDGGEDPVKAALRELHEETGMQSVELIAQSSGWLAYDLPKDLQGKAWGGRFRGQKQKWFAVRVLGPDEEINILPAPGHKREFSSWRWMPAPEILRLVAPFKREVYERVLAEFAPLIGGA
jgi:putative (di)nucleoside polyphosphate hydrolase